MKTAPVHSQRTPFIFQKLIARNWPQKAYLGLATLAGLAFPFAVCQPTLATLRDWHFLLFFVPSVPLGGALAFFLSLLLAFLFLGPIFCLGAKLNGAPFAIGDRVQIIAGPHAGRVTEVYAVWKERGQVRVRLDEKSESAVTDVFAETQVFRVDASA